ncbi:large conductance mechanosensitive channel protein MscL [Demequina lutea]|uniref:Large-conductance mechanosensitive channel n=1 Tax=Demequina lutea TaxID=431489 RepID=A0A7Z0CL28_9MICO|nr:large conductance mechanosensitive channel protein MscL [Demequina lutea]NYI42330.1 large conductance mechanosensitive channel [Demequina lutea]
MLKGFKEFIMRGNVIDLAVAFVIGLAFAPIVTKIVDGLITPLISRIFGQPNLDSVGNIDIGKGAWLAFGPVFTAILNFLAVAAAIYFLIVVPMNKFKKPAVEVESGPTEIQLLAEIRDSVKK